MSEPRSERRPAPSTPNAPEVWAPAQRFVRNAWAPVERFLHVEAASGIVLLLAAVGALIWANSPWAASYASLWHTPISFRLGPWAFERDLHFWINDGLMTVFFFVVGLEIRREMHGGELADIQRASLPLAAALGGMLAPAAIYYAFNYGRETAGGWGVPMATDIAFAVGVLALLGSRVPPALRILLLALAVIDDVGAILVIAVFYSAGFEPSGLIGIVGGMLIILALQRIGVRSAVVYVIPGVLVWAGTYALGVHPTLAGVVLGLMTPVRAWYGTSGLVGKLRSTLDLIEGADENQMRDHLGELEKARTEAVAPVERLQGALHGWVAFLIMPVFAFANAGVPLGSASFEGDGMRVFAGVALGLMVGKPVGVALLSFLAARVGISRLPVGVGSLGIWVVGLSASIGFTMALFIAQLAFVPGPILETAKLAILIGSTLGGLLSYVVGYWVLKGKSIEGAATTAAEAEASTPI